MCKVSIGGGTYLLYGTYGTLLYDCPGNCFSGGPTGPGCGSLNVDCFLCNEYFFFHQIFLPFPDAGRSGTTLHHMGVVNKSISVSFLKLKALKEISVGLE